MVTLLTFVRRSPVRIGRSAFGLRWRWRFGGYIFINFARVVMAQQEYSPAQSVESNNLPSPGSSKISASNLGQFTGANQLAQLTSAPSGIAISSGNSKISTDDPDGASGMTPLAQLTSPQSGIAISPGNNKISTDDLSGPSGINPLTSPASGIGTEPGLPPQELPAYNREAADKKWLLLFNFSTSVTYDDNVFISHQNKQADEIFTVAAGFTFGLGDYRALKENYLLAQYLLTGFFFVRNSQEDAPNQELALKTQFRFSKLTLQTQTHYQYLTGVDRQVGNFVNRTLIDNLVRLNYDYSDKTQFFLSVEETASLYESFLSSYGYVGTLGGEYQISPKIALGGETLFGKLIQDESPSGSYAQLRLLADYNITGKLSFHLSVGEEIRHYDSEGGQTIATPVFSLGLTYQPFQDTSIGLNAYRNVNASPSLAGENYVATGVVVQLSQMLFQRVTAGLSLGYENDKYRATQAGTAEPGRADNYFFIQPTLTYKFRDWLSASLSYEFRRNASNESSSTFSDSRFTLSLGVNF
jgi:hypothetical protein